MARRVRHTREGMIRLIKKHGYNGRRMERKTGWTRSKLTHRLMHHGLRLQPALRYHTDEEIYDAISLCFSLDGLAKYLNLNPGQLKDNLRARGIRTGYQRCKRSPSTIPSEVLLRIYKETGYSIRRTAEQLGFNYTTMQRELRRRGAETSNGRSIFPWDHYELYTLHVVQEFSTWGIAKLYGSTDKAVRNAMHKFGITLIKNRNDGRVPTERPTLPQTDDCWDATPEER